MLRDMPSGVRARAANVNVEPHPATRSFEHGETTPPDWCVASTPHVRVEYDDLRVHVTSTWTGPLQVGLAMEWWFPVPFVEWGRVVWRKPKNWESWRKNQLWGLVEPANDHGAELGSWLRYHFAKIHAGSDAHLAVEALYDALHVPRRQGDWEVVYQHLMAMQDIIRSTVELREYNCTWYRLIREFREKRWPFKE